MFVYIRDVITSDLATNKDGGAFTSVQANESAITLRATAAGKITSVQAGISFNGSGKGLPFLGIYFPHKRTDSEQVEGRKGRNLGLKMGF